MVIKVLRWANVLLILCTVLIYVSPWVSPKTFWPLAILGTAYPLLLLLNLGFVLGWLLLKKWYFLLSLLCVLVGWNYFQRFVGINIGPPETVETPVLTVMSYNLHMLRELPDLEGSVRGKDLQTFGTFLNRKGNIDVLCTQETSENVSARLARHLNYPHHHNFPDRGTTIFSKSPFLEKGTINFPHSNNSCVWADVSLGDQRIRIYSVHLQSNQITNEAEKLAEEGDLQERETWRGMKGIIGQIGMATRIRAEQAQLLGTHIAASPYPVVVCGDFNDTPLSWQYRHILQAGNLQDAFVEKGLGLGTTFNGIIPALRIDYTLLSPSLRVVEHEIWKKAYSDHFPLYTRITTAAPNAER